MRADDPVLGGKVVVSGATDASTSIGATYLGVPTRTPFDIGAGCVVYLDISTLFLLNTTRNMNWTFTTPSIPNNSGLIGTLVALQTVYTVPSFGVRLSNGLYLSLGR